MEPELESLLEAIRFYDLVFGDTQEIARNRNSLPSDYISIANV